MIGGLLMDSENTVEPLRFLVCRRERRRGVSLE